ncbi:lytic transglycosylase domain-containing protein [Aureimonas glaciei]|uniref:Lytic transglycosylase n=1 Tax=Aureimonas glaciei TaxID=1776957 RepID=A0A916YAJ9_9HYPH|nr:lytic transglycosylase domain-containing protein [Aureimonas glaciei]GGD37027.1 lytic transglycosylase [Aureimonas glaciei]
MAVRRGALLSLLASLTAVWTAAAEVPLGDAPAAETGGLAADALTAAATTAKARANAPPGIGPPAPPVGKTGTALICDLIATNAAATEMSPDFFARLIWKESRFDGEALSPVGARGIAQFMPGTARERGLDDPYDISEAIRHSALYLRDLKADLGNWGLAAAAYNGGINRVKRWRVTGGSLPYETENYVLSITARSADWFLEPGREIEAAPLDAAKSFDESCQAMPMVRTRAPAVESAPMQPWGVQVAGSPRQTVALQSFRRVQARFSGILGSKAPIVVRDRASRGRIYAVRIGADSRGEADALCGRLRGAGGSCVVFRN